MEPTEPRSRLGCDARRKVGQWASGSVDAFPSFPPRFLSENKAFVRFKESIFFVFFLETQRAHHGEAKRLTGNPGRTNTFHCFPTFQRASVGREPRLRPPVGLQDPSLPPEIHVWAKLLLAAAAGRASAGGSSRV